MRIKLARAAGEGRARTRSLSSAEVAAPSGLSSSVRGYGRGRSVQRGRDRKEASGASSSSASPAHKIACASGQARRADSIASAANHGSERPYQTKWSSAGTGASVMSTVLGAMARRVHEAAHACSGSHPQQASARFLPAHVHARTVRP